MAATRWEVKQGHQIQAKDSRCKVRMAEQEDIKEATEATIVLKVKYTKTKEVAVAEDIKEAIIEEDSSREVVEDHT